MTRWPFNKLIRQKALDETMRHIHYEDENSRYITIGCVEKVEFGLIHELVHMNAMIILVNLDFCDYVHSRYACLLAGLKIPIVSMWRSILPEFLITYGWLKMAWKCRVLVASRGMLPSPCKLCLLVISHMTSGLRLIMAMISSRTPRCVIIKCWLAALPCPALLSPDLYMCLVKCWRLETTLLVTTKVCSATCLKDLGHFQTVTMDGKCLTAPPRTWRCPPAFEFHFHSLFGFWVWPLTMKLINF